LDRQSRNCDKRVVVRYPYSMTSDGVTTNNRAASKAPAEQAPKAVVDFEVSRTGVVIVKPSDLLQTEAAKSQIKALEHIRERGKSKAAA
jgi:hypothetical protein